ncbi:hypothetical protein V1520DRAFT_110198 [Lipomyces starkeyi]|uniref:C2H2-type domain-containing protein n=1 Tax=Lipomyces starkeyi NRRL Y-11557 TaxID=675824 RepID=A0A1E3Q798_LIPST|nr:hypothetical protein LIPSTDRAFT_2797 [Lipomyces starkeyi NRRL Y-11557]
MSVATLRNRSRQQRRPPILDKHQQQYIRPQQLPPSLSSQMIYHSSPDLSISGSEFERYYSSAVEDSEVILMERMWGQQRSAAGEHAFEQICVPPSSPPQQKYFNSCNSSVLISPETSVSGFLPGQDNNVGSRYDIFSRLPLPSYQTPLLPNLRPLDSTDVSLEYSDYENQDYYVQDHSSYEFPVFPSNTLPYQSGALSSEGFKKPASDLPALSPESDYEADYPSEGLSPGFESTEDITDFSSPELAQGKTFSSPNPSRKVDWHTVWQPILTADPVTNAQFTINVEDERHSKVPTRTLDSYVEGPGADGKYICRFADCGKKFGRKYNIRTHIQTHLADKPHLCTVCGSRFVRHHDLRRHSKTHEDMKPFVCPCGKGFARQDALSRHRMRQICVGGLKSPELK